MYCEECGSKNENGVKFCGSCGHKIEQPKKEKKKLTKSQKLAIIIVGVLAVLAIVYSIIASSFSAKSVVQKFMKNFSSENMSEVYDCLDLSDSPFTTKKIFLENVGDDVDSGIFSYKIDDVEYSSDKKRAEVKVTVKGSSDDNGSTQVIKLKKSGNKFLIFDNWVIDSEFVGIVDKYMINVPKDTKLTVNDIDISKYKNVKKSTDEEDVYVLPTMFNDYYDIEAVLPFGITVTDSFSPSSYDDYELEIDSDSLTEEVKNNINTVATDTINKMYAAVIAGTDAKEFVKTYTTDEDEASDFEEEYNYIKKNINFWDKITSLEVTSMTIDSIELEDNKLIAFVSFDYKYTNDKNKEDTDDKSYVEVELKYVDGQFKVVSLDNCPVYIY